MLKAWNDFAKKISEESPRISNTLSFSLPELSEDKSVTLRLDNSSLREIFDQNFKFRLEHYLHDTLQNGQITINTIVEATERTDILYTDEQKFNHLSAKNAALKDLKKTFNLDFE